MTHAGFGERKFQPAEVDGLAVSDDLNFAVHMKMACQRSGAHFRCENFLRLDDMDGVRQSSGVVHLRMVRDDIVYLAGVYDRSYPLEHLVAEGSLDGIDERKFLAQDQVRVVRRALARTIAMEVANVPVDSSDPINIFRNLDCFKTPACHIKTPEKEPPRYIGKYKYTEISFIVLSPVPWLPFISLENILRYPAL